jgi:surfeit locus 1 family protein
VPGISTLAMLAVLLSLGTWQLQRRAWKADLLSRIDAAEHVSANPLTDSPAAFAKVQASGRLRSDLQVRYGAEVRGTTLGQHLIVPLERESAPPVMVDLGWAPAGAALVLPSGPIDGFVRPPEHAGTFSAKDDPAKRLFYTLDPEKIGAALGYSAVMPFTLVAVGESFPGRYPDPVRTLPRPPDNHLQYAITWFGFACTLLVIFALYTRKTLLK